MVYNWQQKDWREFRFDLTLVEDGLLQFLQMDGQFAGKLNTMHPDSNTEAVQNLIVSEAFKTSQIEGAQLNRDDVVLSIRNNLGLDTPFKK